MQNSFLEYFREYEMEINSRDDRDYEVNPEQMEKFKEAFEFFVKMSDKYHGDITEVDLTPRRENGGITCELPLLYVYEENLITLSNIIKNMSGLSIDAKQDGTVCISFNIPHVFVHK